MPPEPGPLRPAVFHILLVLARRELHGLGIAEDIERATEGAVTLGPGTLYRSLKEMVRDGLVRGIPPPSPDEDPRRRFYSITSEGRAVVEAEARRLARVVDVARENRVLPDASP